MTSVMWAPCTDLEKTGGETEGAGDEYQESVLDPKV